MAEGVRNYGDLDKGFGKKGLDLRMWISCCLSVGKVQEDSG